MEDEGKSKFYSDMKETPPYGNMYRHHFMIKGTTLYLGIQFEYLERVDIGKTVEAEVRLLYDVDYSGLVPGAEFYIMEGPYQVGEGRVM